MRRDPFHRRPRVPSAIRARSCRSLLDEPRRARLDPRRATRSSRPRSRASRRGGCGAATSSPTVAVIVAAYNEEPVIERRIENLLELDYPRDKLEIVVTSDASTDRTEELARSRRARA